MWTTPVRFFTAWNKGLRPLSSPCLPTGRQARDGIFKWDFNRKPNSERNKKGLLEPLPLESSDPQTIPACQDGRGSR
jgi:hypothetical protein